MNFLEMLGIFTIAVICIAVFEYWDIKRRNKR